MKKTPLFKPNNGGGNKTFKKKRLYDSTSWVEYRIRFIQSNPKCYSCGQRAVIVDHWRPHKNDEKLFWNVANFIPLCKSHHDFCTASFDRYNPPKTKEKLEWINAKRLETGTTTLVKIVPLATN